MSLLSSATLMSLTKPHPGNPNFNQNPSTFDRALVPRDSPVCGGGSLSEDEYNLGLHVMALFVVLGQSTLGMLFCAFNLSRD
jgi:zinc transporter 1/2/3